MGTRDLISSIFFNEIINEAKSGEVKILIDGEEETFNVGFNSCVGGVLESGNFGDSKPILMINNNEQLITLLEQYFDECDNHKNKFSNCKLETRIKIYLTLVWANATYEDFANPTLYIKRRIDFYRNKLFSFDKKEYGSAVEALNGSNIIIENYTQDIRQETPYVFKVSFKNQEDGFNLPCISYGISNGECFIYAVQGEKREELTKYQKAMNRRLFKLNSDVLKHESDEYIEYINGEEYYPENISDVSPSAIMALSIFLDELNKHGIEKVKVVTLLPIRYNSKEQAFAKKYEYQLKKKNLTENQLKKLLLEYKRESLRIQQNLSEKMIRNFRRIENHFNNCIITSYPMEFDEYLHMIVREFKISNNTFLNEIMDFKKINISK
ncbi:MAG: hypothetical protein E7165_01015 [Firmicutes bacterium]|nr:hypothetical protein [Bacillota bacterium]